MSLEAWGDEGPTVDESSYEAGESGMAESVIDLLDPEILMLKKDLGTVRIELAKGDDSALYEAETRLLQGIHALERIAEEVKKAIL